MRKYHDSDIGFTKSGEPIVVWRYHRQFATLQFLTGLLITSLMFNATYLIQSGMSATEVGTYISLSSLVGVFAPMFWGMMSDRFKTIKKILYISLSAMLVVYFPIPFYSKLLTGIFSIAPLLIVVQAAFSGTTESMLTAWIIQTQRRFPSIKYGYVRMFYTVSYALANFLYMILIKNTSINSVFIGYAVCAVLILFSLTRYPDVQPSDDERPRRMRDMEFGRVLKNPMLIMYMLFMAIACIPPSSLGLFMPYVINDIGGDTSLLGGIFAIRALSAVPVLYFSHHLTYRISARTSLMLSAFVYLLTQVILIYCQTMTQLFLNSALMGVAMGLMLSSEAHFVNTEAPEGLVTTTQTICGTTYSIAGILSGFLGGVVVDSLGIRSYYRFISVLLAAAILLFFVSTSIILRKRKQQETS